MENRKEQRSTSRLRDPTSTKPSRSKGKSAHGCESDSDSGFTNSDSDTDCLLSKQKMESNLKTKESHHKPRARTMSNSGGPKLTSEKFVPCPTCKGKGKLSQGTYSSINTAAI